MKDLLIPSEARNLIRGLPDRASQVLRYAQDEELRTWNLVEC